MYNFGRFHTGSDMIWFAYLTNNHSIGYQKIDCREIIVEVGRSNIKQELNRMYVHWYRWRSKIPLSLYGLRHCVDHDFITDKRNTV